MSRNFKRLPGQRYSQIAKLDDELDNIYKQLNLSSAETVRHDDSKDLFEIQKYNKVFKINRDTATLGEVVDVLATLIVKLNELNAINVKTTGK